MNGSTQPPEPVIELAGLTRRFRDRAVLRGVDLTVRRGELLGFVGPNGSGKSTCMRILLGMLRRHGGTARVFGLDPWRESLAVRRRASYLPGEVSAYPAMRGGEFLEFALSFHPHRRREVLGELGEHFALPMRKRVRAYSSGMKQKLALLASLGPDVELYLLDEPDRALDATTRIVLRRLLEDLRTEGRTVLLSTHHLAEIEAIADRLAFLHEGRILPDATVAAARDALRDRLLVRLRRGASLPQAGVLEVDEVGDGRLRVRVDGPALHWLARLDPETVEAAEVGATRLDDVYRALTEIAAPVESMVP